MENYKEALEYLNGRTKKNLKKTSTYLEKHPTEDIIYLFYHNTAVVTYKPEGFEVYTGGYYTVTTKSRINEFTPLEFNVYQKNYTWFADIKGETYEFNLVQNQLIELEV